MPAEFSSPATRETLQAQVDQAQARCLSGRPPSPAEMAGLLAACRALAGEDRGLELGQRVVELIFCLARDWGPDYLAALDREQA